MSRYKTVMVNGVQVKEHRAVWEAAHGPIPEGMVIHHINGDAKDNRLENLMLLSHSDHIALHHTLRREGMDPVNPNDPDVIKDREQSRSSHLAYRKERLGKMRNYHASHLEEAKAYRDEHRDEANAKGRARYAKNREVSLARNKAYRDAHKEEINARVREYNRTHRAERKAYRESRKEIIAEQGKAYRAAHKEERAAWQREYDKTHKEENAARHKKWYAENRERLRALERIRASRPEYKAYRAVYIKVRRAIESGKPQAELDKLQEELKRLKSAL